MKKDMTEYLRSYLVGKTWFFEEEAAKEFQCPKADISRAVTQLRKEGWSINAKNDTAYMRGFGRTCSIYTPVQTGRKKGEKNRIDPNEPEWVPTRFNVKPPKDI
jgi:hypothetical protein